MFLLIDSNWQLTVKDNYKNISSPNRKGGSMGTINDFQPGNVLLDKAIWESHRIQQFIGEFRYKMPKKRYGGLGFFSKFYLLK